MPYLHKWLNVISLKIVFAFRSKEDICCCRSIKSLTVRLDESNWCLLFFVWCKPFNIVIVVTVAKFPILHFFNPNKVFPSKPHFVCKEECVSQFYLYLLCCLPFSLLLLVVSRFLYIASSSPLLPFAWEPSSKAFATAEFAHSTPELRFWKVLL